MKRSVPLLVAGLFTLSTCMLVSGGCGSEPTPPAAPVEIHDAELQQMEEEGLRERAESANEEAAGAENATESTEVTEATDLP